MFEKYDQTGYFEIKRRLWANKKLSKFSEKNILLGIERDVEMTKKLANEAADALGIFWQEALNKKGGVTIEKDALAECEETPSFVYVELGLVILSKRILSSQERTWFANDALSYRNLKATWEEKNMSAIRHYLSWKYGAINDVPDVASSDS